MLAPMLGAALGGSAGSSDAGPAPASSSTQEFRNNAKTGGTKSNFTLKVEGDTNKKNRSKGGGKDEPAPDAAATNISPTLLIVILAFIFVLIFLVVLAKVF